MARLHYRSALALVCFGSAAAAGAYFAPRVSAYFAPAAAGAQQGRDVSVTGNQFAFSPARVEVQKDDLVKITFSASDMAHSFTIDNYRIAKRAGAGQTVTFEFRADQPGEHTFYCNLTQDDRCRNMKGTLVVR